MSQAPSKGNRRGCPTLEELPSPPPETACWPWTKERPNSPTRCRVADHDQTSGSSPIIPKRELAGRATGAAEELAIGHSRLGAQKAMKLLVISAAFPPFRAGESEHALQLCRHLADRGVDVHLLTRRMDIRADSYPFSLHPCIRSWTWSDLPSVATFLWRCTPDATLLLYSGWIYDGHPMITFLPTLSKKLSPRAPFVTQFETIEESHPTSTLIRGIRKVVKTWVRPTDVDYSFGTLLRDSDSIIALSQTHMTRLTQRFSAVSSKGVVIPPPPLIRICPDDDGVSRRRGREAIGVTQREFLVAYFGYLHPSKGMATLLKALQIISALRPDVRLVVVGGGSGNSDAPAGGRSELMTAHREEMIDFARRLKIDDKVIWMKGYATDSDEASLYLRAADACVLPFDKGISLNNSTFAAAAAHGLPIITTRGELVESPFVDRRNVLLCAPKDPKALAAAIVLLVATPDLQRELRTGALEIAAQWFSWEKAISATMTTLKSPQQ